MIDAAKALLRRLLLARGYAVYNLRSYHARMDSALRALSRRRHQFNSVIDVGASDGRWSSLAMRSFPDATYLLIEANKAHESSLVRFSATHHNARFVLAAAGDAEGEIHFDATDSYLGQATHSPGGTGAATVPMTTIDREVASRMLRPPYLIKLDTHGFEVPILNGASETLRDTEAIVIECYNFRISPECLLFFEMCEYLGRLGFRCADLVDPRHRPYDQTLWQIDLVFLKGNSREFSYSEFY
jgi:FkbM family methyltransferase